MADVLSGVKWRLDEITILLRTAAQLGNDVTVLTELAKPRPDRYANTHYVGAASEADTASELPAEIAVLLPPVLGMLATQGLIVDAAPGAWDYGGPRWLLTPYAFRFVRYLSPAEEFDHATVALSFGNAKIFVRNLGLGPATVTNLEATSDGRALLGSAALPIHLGAGESVAVPCDTDLDRHAMVRLGVTWLNAAGVESTSERLHGRG